MRGVVDVEPCATLREAARRMRTEAAGSLLVYRDGRLRGILTEHDVVEAIGRDADPDRDRVSDWMTSDPATAGPDEDSADLAMRMSDFGFRHLVVVQGGREVGVISARDLLMAEAQDAIDRDARSRREAGRVSRRDRDQEALTHPPRPSTWT